MDQLANQLSSTERFLLLKPALMSRKILEYFTVVDAEIKGLDKQVDALVQQGYEPYGSPYVVPGEKVQICQAVIRCENLEAMTLSAETPL